MTSELETSVVAAAAQSEDDVQRVAIAVELRRRGEGQGRATALEKAAGAGNPTALAEAMAIVEAADPETKMRIELAKNVAGIDFVAEARAQRLGRQPSCDPAHHEEAERQARSLAEQVERERRITEQRAASREELIEHMSAGQSEANRLLIRRTISLGG